VYLEQTIRGTPDVRVDIMVKDGNRFDFLDIAIVNPAAPSYHNKNAADVRFKSKLFKYNKSLTPAQSSRVIPIIIESSGLIHSATMDYFNYISDYVPGKKPNRKLANLRRTFLKDLNIILVKKNYNIISLFLNQLSTVNPVSAAFELNSRVSRIDP